jgi:hypothetical protein
VGVRTADMMTLSRMGDCTAELSVPGLHRADGIFTQHVLHLFHHAVAGPLDLADPPPIDGAHAEHPVDELDGRHPGERLANRKLPREVRSIFRRRLTANDCSEHA